MTKSAVSVSTFVISQCATSILVIGGADKLGAVTINWDKQRGMCMCMCMYVSKSLRPSGLRGLVHRGFYVVTKKLLPAASCARASS